MFYFVYSLALLLGADPAAAAAPPATRWTLRPAPAPTPALKYRLLPALKDQAPGNAAVAYFRALTPDYLTHRRRPGIYPQIELWKTMPLAELPRTEMEWLRSYRPLRELDFAARRDYCNWELSDRLRTEGMDLPAGDVQAFRDLAVLLAVRARLQMADRHLDEALDSLQTGFALSRDVGKGTFLLHALLEAGFLQLMADQVELFLQQPGSPNLYWALSELPQPFIDLRSAAEADRLLLTSQLPVRAELERGPLTPERALNIATRLLETLLREGRPGTPGLGAEERLYLTMVAAKCYPTARRYLIEHGHATATVEAMPTLQVVLLYSLDQFERFHDDMAKWLALPYWQAAAGLARADEQLRQARNTTEEGIPFASHYLPAAQRVAITAARADQRLALLRCIEAIRLHAASHDGQLPQHLGDITVVPVPVDPVTGKEFTYQADGDRATLSVPMSSDRAAGAVGAGLRYELVLTR